MAMNEEINEASQNIGKAVTDNLEDTSPAMSPDDVVHNEPEFRADVGVGPWKAPPSAWKINDEVYLKLQDGNLAGPFHIVKCHEPTDRNSKWRYDVKDAKGNTRSGISSSKIV